MKNKPIKIASRKQKGRNLQNWIAKKLSEMLGLSWGKDTEIRPREMGQSGVDVVLSERVTGIFPFSIEAKNTEILNIWKAIDQAKANEKPNTSWILFIKRNKVKPVVVLDAEDFFEIYSDVLKYHYKDDIPLVSYPWYSDK